MAYIRCETGGGTPSMTETTLWTNSTPSSNFTGKDITLSEDYTTFTYIKIEYKAATTKNTSTYLLVPPSALTMSVFTDPSTPLVSISGRRSSSPSTVQQTRRICHVSNTSLNISDAYQINAASMNNDGAIPLKISGLK